MLRYRLVFGTLMIIGLLVVITLDTWLDTVPIDGTFWQWVFLGRVTPPPGLLLMLLFFGVIILAARELAEIFQHKQVPVDARLIAVGGLALCTMLYVVPHRFDGQIAMALLATLIGVIVAVSLMRYSRGGRTDGVAAMAAVTLLAALYLGLPTGFYAAMRRWHEGWMIVAVLLTTKSSDIGAYFTGRFIGQRKLIPWLSPGKTWEGLVGGLIFSGLIGLGLAYLFNVTGNAGFYTETNLGVRDFHPVVYPLWGGFVTGVAFGLLGQGGDLAASLLKRDAGIKDSGKSIPGFGGLLDVLDSPIAVAPIAYWLLCLAAWQ